MMHTYEVGQPYNPKRTRWPEGPHLRITPDGIEFALFMDRPTATEVREYKQGSPQWAWIGRRHVGVLLYRFGAEPWSDTPFEAHRAIREYGAPPGNLVQMVLVDASTGIIKVLRMLAWSPEFLAGVLKSVGSQLERPHDPRAAAAELQALYTQESAALARSAELRDSGKTRPTPEADTHRNRVDAAAVISRTLGRYLVTDKSYHSELEPGLQRWYCYTADGGHSIVAAVKSQIPQGGADDLADYTAPLPVKMVRRLGWTETPDGYLVVDAPYDPHMGVVAEVGDDEF